MIWALNYAQQSLTTDFTFKFHFSLIECIAMDTWAYGTLEGLAIRSGEGLSLYVALPCWVSSEGIIMPSGIMK